MITAISAGELDIALLAYSSFASAIENGKMEDLRAIADDFQGTAPSGKRFGKAEAIATDATALDHGCQLDDAKVRYFGDNLAMVYGSERSMRKAEDGKENMRCLIWTDTWLKRNGKWQIIAAQDTAVPCK